MTQYLFDPPDISLPTLSVLRDFMWEHIPDGALKDCIVQEEQSLAFHKAMLKQLCFQGSGPAPSRARPIDLSLRAGIIRSAVKLYASIAEAALLYHGVRRGFINLDPSQGRWTLGKIKRAWERPPGSGTPQPDVAAIWADLGTLQDIRNHVHLLEMARGQGHEFRDLNAREQELIEAGKRVLGRLRDLQSP